MNFQPKAIPMLNGDEYVMLQLEEWHNKYGVFDVPSEIAYDKDYFDFYNYSKNTDWIGELTRVGRTNDHYFNISGGGDKTRYFTSFSYVDEKGTTLNTDAKTFISRVNLDYFLSKKTLFSVQFSYTNEKVGGNISLNDENARARNVRQMAYIKAPNMSIWEYDAYGNLTGEYFNPINSYQGSGATYYNPIAVANLGKNDSKSNRLQNNFTLSYNIKRWLTFRETLSFQFAGSKSYNYLPYNALGSDWLDWTVNKGEESNNINTSINTESQLAFDSPFDSSKHSVSGSVAWITNQSSYEWMNLQSRNLPSVELQDPATGGRINWIGDGSGESRNVGALLNLNYKYNDRYMVQGILRADAYSLFGENSRWGLFKGASFGWRFSDEEFLDNANWLGESMFRLSWGVSGKPPEGRAGLPEVTYARYATYESGSHDYMDHVGIVNNQIQLDNLKWQSVEQSDIGLETSLFNDRFYMEGDIYKKVTKDLIFAPYYIPSSSGFDQIPYLNGGKLENKGWELMLVYHIIRKKDLKVSLNFNTSHNVNAFKSFPDNFNREKDVTLGDGKYPLRSEEGQPVGSFFGFRYLGVYATDEDAYARDAQGNILVDYAGDPMPMVYGSYKFSGGDAKYADLNHDGQIDLNDVEYIGDSNPDFIGGFGASVKYKNFDFTCGWHYRTGFDIVNRNAINTQGMNDKKNQSKAVLNRWRVEGQNYKGLLPRAYLDNDANNLGSDRYVEKGDYLRLLNVIVGYRFKQEFCQKLSLRSLGVSLSARKILTFTEYTGEDPEISQDASDPFWIGEDQSNTPPPRVYTISISVGF
jgi:TonB-linked SusC/RagA family outer membrane protein